MTSDYKFSSFVEETLNFLQNKKKRVLEENAAEDTGIATTNGYMDLAISSPNPDEKELFVTAFKNSHFAIYFYAQAVSAFAAWSSDRNPTTWKSLQNAIKSARRSASTVKRSTIQFQKKEKFNGKSEENDAQRSIMAVKSVYGDTLFMLLGQIAAGAQQLSTTTSDRMTKSQFAAGIDRIAQLAEKVIVNGADAKNPSILNKLITDDKNLLYYSGAFLEGFDDGQSIMTYLNSAEDEELGPENEPTDETGESPDAAVGREMEEEEEAKEAAKEAGIDFEYMTKEEMEEAAERFASELRDLKRIGVDVTRPNGDWESDESFLKRMVGKLVNVRIDFA